MFKLYSAASLGDIAAQFERQAKVLDNRAACQRVQREKNKLSASADTWREAAEMLRNMELKSNV